MPPDLTLQNWRSVILSRSSAPSPLVDAMRTDPDGLLADGRMLKDGDRCTVVRVEIGSQAFSLKRFNLKGIAHTAVHTAMRSRASWCWKSAQRLVELGFRVAPPQALREDRAGPLRFRSYLASEWVEGTSCDVLLQQATDAELETLANAFAALWNQLGRHKVIHGDMKASNFIREPGGRICMIDLDGVRFDLSPRRYRIKRDEDRWCLLRNFSDFGVPHRRGIFERALDQPPTDS